MLSMRCIDDRCTDLRIPRGFICVIPVIGLAALNLARQMVRIICRQIPLKGIQMRRPVAPVPHPRIPVDPDKRNRRIRPQRVQRKQDVPAAIAGHIRAILGPVGCIGNIGIRQDGLDVSRQRTKRFDKRYATALRRYPSRIRALASRPPQFAARGSLSNASGQAVFASRAISREGVPKGQVHFMSGSVRSGCLDGREANPAGYPAGLERPDFVQLFRDALNRQQILIPPCPEIVCTSVFLRNQICHHPRARSD